MTEKIENIKNSKSKKSVKILLAVIAALILIVSVSWYLSRDNKELKEGVVVIKADNALLGSFTIEDLKKLPQEEKEMEILNSCSGDCGNNVSSGSTRHIYKGTPLSSVLSSIDPKLISKYEKVITKGADCYSQVFEMTDVRKTGNIYVVHSDYGKPLKTKDNRDGGLQIISAEDKYGQRFTKWLVSIELQ